MNLGKLRDLAITATICTVAGFFAGGFVVKHHYDKANARAERSAEAVLLQDYGIDVKCKNCRASGLRGHE